MRSATDTEVIPESHVTFQCCDARDIPIDDESVEMITTSPPYNLGVNYANSDDNLDIDDYREFIKEVAEELYRVTIPGGRAAVNVGIESSKPLEYRPRIVRDAFETAGWQLGNRHIWDKGSAEQSAAWGSWRSASNPRTIIQHEEILVFFKSTPGRDPDQDKPKHIPKNRFLTLTKSVWRVQPNSSSEHPAPMPVELARRCIELYSLPEDTVLDPFVGTGTTAIAAAELGRKAVGVDISPKYVEMAEERVRSVAYGDEGIPTQERLQQFCSE